MTPHLTHLMFDVLAVICALTCGALVYRWRLTDNLRETASRLSPAYFLFLAFGSIAGAYGFGTLNLYLSGIPEIGRSIVGALLGATLMVELYKVYRGVTGSTGYIYVIPFAVLVAVGRIGCLLAGLEDRTHGVETGAAWGWDFGDGLLRHPVQLYESISMAVFAVVFVLLLKHTPRAAISHGFYWCVGFYGLQRFLWEFLKPYGQILGPLNVFHLACLTLFSYSIFMMLRAKHDSN